MTVFLYAAGFGYIVGFVVSSILAFLAEKKNKELEKNV